MHRIENAAVRRFWPGAPKPAGRGHENLGRVPRPTAHPFASRELDISTSFLLSKPPLARVPIPEFLPAPTKVGDLAFAGHDLGLPFLQGGTRLEFDTPPLETTRIAVVTSLAFSTHMADGTPVATVRLRGRDGHSFQFDLRAGIDSSEWATDRPSLKRRCDTLAPHRLELGIKEGQENMV